jgi:hypothetical protein
LTDAVLVWSTLAYISTDVYVKEEA